MPRNSVRTKFQLTPTFRFGTFFAALAIAVFCSSNLIAQQPGDVTLDIGSTAPALDIATWVSDRDGAFEPVTEFTDGKIYVVEFWATWCPPCVASMPHLAKIQEERFDDGVQIISVTDEDIATVEGFLQRDVRGEDGLTYKELTSVYCLTADPDGSTSRDYMEAAGQNGIPTAFIVGKSGLIEWTGHPMKLDEPLQEIIADAWDRDAYKLEIQKERERQAAMEAAMGQLEFAMGEVDKKLSAGDDEGALELMGELIDNDTYEPMRQRLTMIRSQLALTMKGPSALAAFNAGGQAVKDSPGALNELAWSAVETVDSGEQVAPEILVAALKAAQTALEADTEDPSVLDTISHLFHLQGELDKAIATQELAVKNAGDLAPQLEPFLNQLKAEKAVE
jgi:thiol-disulfide isomerase/thioredoxin